MPKPANKQQLMDAARKEYTALEELLGAYTPEEMTAPGALGDWSVKDVLAHLLEWQRMLFGWYEAGLRGLTPPVPAWGYKWSELPALNQHIWENYSRCPLDEILAEFRLSHTRVIELIDGLPEADLFTPGLYSWMRANTLAAYFNSTTASHYLWARTEMRKTRSRAAKA